MAQSSVQKLAAAERLRAEADAALARAADLARQALAQRQSVSLHCPRNTRARSRSRPPRRPTPRSPRRSARASPRRRNWPRRWAKWPSSRPSPSSLEAALVPAPARVRRGADIVEADAGLADALEAAAQQSRDAHAAAKSDADCCAAAPSRAALSRPAGPPTPTAELRGARATPTGLVHGVWRTPSVRSDLDASPAAASDARSRAASLSKVVGEQRALRKLAVGDVAAPAPSAPADDAAPAVEVAAEEAGDVGSWLFSTRGRGPIGLLFTHGG